MKPPRGGGTLLKVGILAGLAAGAFALVLFVLRPWFPPGASVASKEHKPAPKVGHVLSLDAVVVNIAQTEGRRYLKTAIQLEVPKEEKVIKEIEGRKAQILDGLIAILTKKSLADLTGPDALDRLRNEMNERIGQDLGRDRVYRVFITEFVVQ
jgi:flagellar basal body-associated protein FliL